jgi:hypothetical protein
MKLKMGSPMACRLSRYCTSTVAFSIPVCKNTVHHLYTCLACHRALHGRGKLHVRGDLAPTARVAVGLGAPHQNHGALLHLLRRGKDVVLRGRVAAHPGVFERFFGSVPTRWVNIEQVREQILGRRTQVLCPARVPELKLCLHDIVVRDAGRIVIEWEASTQQD